MPKREPELTRDASVNTASSVALTIRPTRSVQMKGNAKRAGSGDANSEGGRSGVDTASALCWNTEGELGPSDSGWDCKGLARRENACICDKLRGSARGPHRRKHEGYNFKNGLWNRASWSIFALDRMVATFFGCFAGIRRSANFLSYAARKAFLSFLLYLFPTILGDTLCRLYASNKCIPVRFWVQVRLQVRIKFGKPLYHVNEFSGDPSTQASSFAVKLASMNFTCQPSQCYSLPAKLTAINLIPKCLASRELTGSVDVPRISSFKPARPAVYVGPRAETKKSVSGTRRPVGRELESKTAALVRSISMASAVQTGMRLTDQDVTTDVGRK
ncbi:hypothetical protein DFH07DRAFT_779186 [Mycena maculata]|uniref:Uncharacterized protein n=1 Tax=Mycena maculata TaxID=230809 RepID=A0AAD7MYK8_9AGAR|nr:hypothetical protein DFH07DRAFT_779186 [Mycena maculata]